MRIAEELTSLKISRDFVIFVVSAVFLAATNHMAFASELALILYLLIALGATSILLRHRELFLANSLLAVIAISMFFRLYLNSRGGSDSVVLGVVRDATAIGAFLVMTCHLMIANLRAHSRHQAEVDEAQELSSADSETSQVQVIQKTSREIETPLSNITTLCETLLDQAAGDISDAQRELIQDVDESARHLLGIVNDIADYSRANAGMIHLSPQPVALGELVEQCVAAVQSKAERENISVAVQFEHNLSEVVADPLRLEQMLRILLAIAVRSNSEDGTVAVRIRAENKHLCRISVRDTGRGIGEEHLARVFDPYYMASVDEHGFATGLGLAIVKHLAELHGGTIQIESVKGTGTLFIVRLPLPMPHVADDESIAIDDEQSMDDSPELSPQKHSNDSY